MENSKQAVRRLIAGSRAINRMREEIAIVVNAVVKNLTLKDFDGWKVTKRPGPGDGATFTDLGAVVTWTIGCGQADDGRKFVYVICSEPTHHEPCTMLLQVRRYFGGKDRDEVTLPAPHVRTVREHVNGLLFQAALHFPRLEATWKPLLEAV